MSLYIYYFDETINPEDLYEDACNSSLNLCTPIGNCFGVKSRKPHANRQLNDPLVNFNQEICSAFRARKNRLLTTRFLFEHNIQNGDVRTTRRDLLTMNSVLNFQRNVDSERTVLMILQRHTLIRFLSKKKKNL